MDVDSIEPGEDFGQVIDRTVGACQVLVAVIGQKWLSAAAEGKPRLHHPDDFVRLEIATALRREIRVIPVLVQGATMPSAAELPDDLQRLVRRNALDVDDLHWNSGIERLIGTLEKILGETTPPPPPAPARQTKRLPFAAGLAAVLILGAVAAIMLRSRPGIRETPAHEASKAEASAKGTAPAVEEIRRSITIRADRSSRPTDTLPDGRTRHLYSIWIEAPPAIVRQIAKVRYRYDHYQFESPRTERSNPADGFRDSYNGIGAVNADMDVVVVLWDGTEILFKFNMYQAVFGSDGSAAPKEPILKKGVSGDGATK